MFSIVELVSYRNWDGQIKTIQIVRKTVVMNDLPTLLD